MPTQAGDPVERQVDAYNRRDLEAFLECYSPDAVIEDTAGKVVVRERDDMRTRYGELLRDSPTLHAHVATRIRIGDYVIYEERVTGHRSSPAEIHVVAIDDVIDHVRLIR